jgi:molybdenum cofactor cytidylyltransferase
MSSGIAAIVLAAGGSTRLGQPKQLLEFHGETLVHAAARAALEGGCDLVCVVTGHEQDAVTRAIADLRPVIFVHNEGWQRGMGSSIRLGVGAVQMVNPVSVAALLLTCDQPTVDEEVVRGLIEHRRRTGKGVVASEYEGTLGIPALFDRACFPELLRLPEDRGAKAVIQADPERIARFEFPAGAIDLDSPEDVRKWREKGAR